MSDYLKLSDKVKAICKAYYQTKCGECPIRPKCVEHFPTTKEALNKHTTELNELAETVKIEVNVDG